MAQWLRRPSGSPSLASILKCVPKQTENPRTDRVIAARLESTANPGQPLGEFLDRVKLVWAGFGTVEDRVRSPDDVVLKKAVAQIIETARSAETLHPTGDFVNFRPDSDGDRIAG
jgi:hypothetical protein